MKNVILITLIAVMVSVLSCKKDRSSFWEVNNESFSTNEIEVSYSPGGTGFHTISMDDGFSMSFFPGGGLPTSGSSNIGGDPTNHNNIDMVFYYNSKRYIPAHPEALKCRLL
jgi:hypothetical protein